MTTVLIVDDHPLVRDGLRAVLEATDDLTVLGEAADGEAAVRAAADLHPDVVLMDLQMPGMHGIEATRQVLRDAPGTAVLVLTMFDDDDTIFSAMAAGASGYLLKGSSGADIVAGIRAAATGTAVFGPALAGRIAQWFAAARPHHREVAFPELSDREREILDGVAAGLTNGQIGQRLHLSAKTVANNVSAILNKLQLSQRSDAIIRARDAGLGREAAGPGPTDRRPG